MAKRSGDLSHYLVAIAEEHRQRGRVDLQRWVSELPQYADYLAEFVFDLEGQGGLPEAGSNEEWHDEGGAIASLLEQHASEPVYEEAEIGRALGKLRRASGVKRDQRHQFRRAAVYAWAFDIIRSGQPTATAYETGKGVYLLEETMGLGLFSEHKQMSYGPFDRTLKYGGARTIAQKRNWFTTSENASRLSASDNLSEAARYAANYVKDAAVARRFLEYVASFSFTDLEGLSTVLWACRRLEGEDEPPTPPTLLRWLETNWPEKVKRPHFDLHTIADNLARLRRLQAI